MSVTTSNIFAALGQKKKKSSKPSDEGEEKKSEKKSKKKSAERQAELERAIFSQPAVQVSSWADCDDEDEFDEPNSDWTEVRPLLRGGGGGLL